MYKKKRQIRNQHVLAFIILFSSLFLGGCSLLTLPIKATEMVFNLVGKAFDLAQKVPMPPPGVF